MYRQWVTRGIEWVGHQTERKVGVRLAVSVRDDGALVQAVQRGDGDAFAELFRRHYPEVRKACARRLLDTVEADEVAQAAFVRAYERIDQCRGDRRFGPWVHVIARSLCIDAFRSQARVEPFEQPLTDGLDRRPDDPEESVLRSERDAHVRQALAALPDRQRQAVIARDWEERRPGEIADSLGLTVGAVDSLLLRARRRLALSYRRLTGEGGGGAHTRAVRAAATAAGVALAFGSQAVMATTSSAAQAVQETASRAAGGVVSAVMTVALTLSGSGPPPAPPAVERPAVVTAVDTTLPAPAARTQLATASVTEYPPAPEAVTSAAAAPPTTVVPTVPTTAPGAPPTTIGTLAVEPATAPPTSVPVTTTLPAPVVADKATAVAQKAPAITTLPTTPVVPVDVPTVSVTVPLPSLPPGMPQG